jgi:U-box domain
MRKINTNNDTLKLYTFFSVSGAILITPLGYLCDEKFRLASGAAMQKLNFLSETGATSFLDVAIAAEKGAIASGASYTAGIAAGTAASEAVVSGMAADLAVTSAAAKSTWLGAIGWFFHGNTTLLAFMVGALIGGAFTWWLIKKDHARLLNSPAVKVYFTKLKMENETLRQTVRLLTLQMKNISALNIVMGEDSFIEPKNSTPEKYVCPITCMIMNDPVYIDDDKHAYERKAISLWYYQSSYKTSPLTRSPLTDPTLLPTDFGLKNEIEHHLKSERMKNESRLSSLIKGLGFIRSWIKLPETRNAPSRVAQL